MQIAVASDVLRTDVFRLVVGQLMLTAGAGALVLYGIRSRITDRSTRYFGLAAFLYGLRLIFELESLRSAFPSVPWTIFESCITLVIGLPFVLFLGSTIGRAYSWFVRAMVIANVLFATVGTVRLIQHASMNNVWKVNGWLVVASMAGWVYIGLFPKIPIDREVRALRHGLLVLGALSVYQNLGVIGAYKYQGFIEPMGMIFLLGTFLYVSASRSFRMETNLISIRNELDIAHQIQSALLPKLDQDIAGMEIHSRYSPMGSVAGDFYDVLSDGRGIGVLIADVSGHGVPAALSASMLKVALRAQAEQIASPAEVLAGLNRTLQGMLGSQFITAAYVYFDPTRRELSYAGAGHPPLLLWRAATNEVESLEENGLFLGPFPEAAYSTVTVPFAPGDRCLLYTDGVVEASNRSNEEYGALRLSEFLSGNSALPANSACSALLEQITKWSGGVLESQQDDITFVLIEFRPKAFSRESSEVDLALVESA